MVCNNISASTLGLILGKTFFFCPYLLLTRRDWRTNSIFLEKASPELRRRNIESCNIWSHVLFIIALLQRSLKLSHVAFVTTCSHAKNDSFVLYG
ncbi:hypothetical protein AVEN_165706-1 [Araneus ventricosus]|uniref:Uncharacterized protein n=1 Tax=Araneus ventricosus TaxID=182803 RepID=A0A4Y2C5H2_ARAVE|nr:hypothetical protein AVEN_165706-1 [Araneus ventricosus]